MRASVKIQLLKELLIALSVLCVFTGIACYKIGSVIGYNNCIEHVID